MTLTFPLTIGVLMSDLVTCPAPIEMCRPGSPMRVVRDYPDPDPHNEDESAMLDGIGQRVIFFGDYDEADHRASDPRVVRVLDFGDGEVDPIPLEALAMNLDDETGEQHAVSWVAEQMGMDRRGAHLIPANSGRWVLVAQGCTQMFSARPAVGREDLVHVPALAGIPATDEGRLRAVAGIVEHLIAIKPSEAP